MKTLDELKDEAIKVLDLYISQGNQIKVTYADGLLSHYFDGSGQRDHFLADYNFGTKLFKSKEDKEKGRYSGFFRVFRLLSFENGEDIGSNLAILGVININKVNAISITYGKEDILIVADYINIKITTRKVRIVNAGESKPMLECGDLTEFKRKMSLNIMHKTLGSLPYLKQLDIKEKIDKGEYNF